MKILYASLALLLLFSATSAQVLKKTEPVYSPEFRKARAAHDAELRIPRKRPAPLPPRPYIGITMEPLAPAEVEKAGGPKNCAGIKLGSVQGKTAADKAGLRAGDIVIATIADEKRAPFTPAEKGYSPLAEIVKLVKDKKPGDKITIVVLRRGKEIITPITLGTRPVYDMPEAPHPQLAPAKGAPSRLARFLHDNKLLDKYLGAADMLYAASNMIQGSRRIVEDKPDFFRLKQITYLLRHPQDTALVSEQIADTVEAAFNTKTKDLPRLIRAAAGWLDEPADSCMVIGLKGEAADIERAVRQMEYAAKLRKEAFRGLTPEDKLAVLNLPKIHLGGIEEGEVMPALKAAAKVDYKKLFTACVAFAAIADQSDLLKKCAETFKGKEVKGVKGVTGKVLYYRNTPHGGIIIGGEGPNVYSVDDAAIIIDLGGDDIYVNPPQADAGAAPSQPFSMVIDFSGDDVYTSKRAFSQGGAFMGCAILLDLDGNDTYRGGAYCQGAALLGVGLLVDHSGHDTYRAIKYSQGSAAFGIGILAEGDGRDSYHAERYAQGLGMGKGFGAIVEAAGNDSYYLGGSREDHRAPGRSYVSMGQGFGFGMRPYKVPVGTSGGIGLLADASGHDRYIADYFCQGASYWYALGILRDRDGMDHYYCGRSSQGAGIHLSLGALIDNAGDDSYISYFGVSQGCGHDWAYGILEDKAGNDYYQAGWLSQGAGNDVGIGVLLDHKGNDHYVGKKDVQGHGTYHEARGQGSVGIFMDLGGRDKYVSPNGSADGLVKKKDTQIGLFFDLPPVGQAPAGSGQAPGK